jgi:hypothetical protein
MTAAALLTTIALAPALVAPASAMPPVLAAPAPLTVSTDYLQARAGGPGSSAWALVVDRVTEPTADGEDRQRPWTAPGALNVLAERLSLSLSRSPSTEGRRDRLLTVGLKLQF